MSGSPEDDVATDAEFETALGALIATALRNGVDLRGSRVYDAAEGSNRRRIEVMIHELEPADEPDD